MESSSYQHIDDTSGKVNGENHHVQIVCNENYSAYFTTAKKDRLTIIDVLTNFAPRRFIYNRKAKSLLREMKLSEKLIVAVEKTLEEDKTYDENKFNDLLEVIKPGPQQLSRIKFFSKNFILETRILDACLIAAYQIQTDYPVISCLLSDDAPQFKLVTEKPALCCIHDGRHYKKLKPLVPKFREKLETFRGQYWDYYAELYKYKENPNPTEAECLQLKFDQLFQTTTGYAQLDDRIAKTLSKKDELVLNQPELPLHNNAAELAARCQTRNRDISLQTKSVAGTKVKDTFLTLTQTAKKLGVRVYDYIYDRVCGKNELPSLAELIRQKSNFQNPASPSGP